MIFRYFFKFLILCLFPSTILYAQQEPADLYITRSFGTKGDIISLHIKANNFQNILSFQASINWDPTALAYSGVSDFGIKDFGEQNFGTANAGKGHVRFIWEPQDATAISIDDSTTVFTIQFEIIADQSGDVSIGFIDTVSNPAFPIEFANSSFDVVAVNTFDGNIIVTDDVNSLVNIESTPNTSCDENAFNASLKADVDGDSVNYTFHWFIGSISGTNPDHTGYQYNGIPAGDYTVQVLDLGGNILIESINTSILEESDAFQLTVSSTSNNYCSENKNGSAIAAVLEPENRDLRYYWFYEADEIDTLLARHIGDSYDGLPAGMYRSWVIDLVSECAGTELVEVEDSLIITEAVITQHNDTLFSSDENAEWYRNDIFLQLTGGYLVPDQTGTYSIEITNVYGCLSTSEPYYFGITGLTDLSSEILISPNPFNDFIRISNSPQNLQFIRVISSQGVLIKEISDIKEPFIDLYLSDSHDGIYFIMIQKDGKIHIRKVVKNMPK